MKCKIFFLTWAILAATSVGASAENQTSDKSTIKMRWILAHEPVRVFERAAKHFAELVAKETDGHIQVEIITGSAYSPGKTMSAEQAFSLVKSGSVEMTQTYTTYLGNHSAPFWALDLPFLFKDHEHARRVLQGPVGDQILAGLEPSNIEGLAFTYSGGYMIIPTAKKQIASVEDFKGLKVRVNNDSPVGTALMKSLGAVPMTSQAVNSNADGFETTYARFIELEQDTQNQNRVINDLQHSMFLTAILINKNFFDSLPAKYQQAIKRSAHSAAQLEREDSIHDGEVSKQQFKDHGFKVVSMEPAQMKKFAAAVGPVYKKFEPVVGKDLIDSIKRE